MVCDFPFLSLFILAVSCSTQGASVNTNEIEGQNRVWTEEYSDKRDYEFLSSETEEGLFEDRISGGEIVKPNSIPYQVGINVQKDGKTTWCGGCIISSRFIVTAAHCLDSGISADLMLGAHDRTITTEKGRVNLKVKKSTFMLHEKFNRKSLLNDIALIKLSSPINVTATIQPIALPWNLNKTFVGENVTFSGWGRYNSQEISSRYLRQARSVIAPNSECANDYEYFKPDTNICLDGSKGQGTCKGDSGGPVVARSSNNITILIGVISFGSSSGCDKRTHNVPTRITAYLSWLEKKMK